MPVININHITHKQVIDLANLNGYEPKALYAISEVEGAGSGFSSLTGKILIQFEPAWFKRTYKDWKTKVSGQVWINNGVGNQAEEWLAFNSAYKISPDSAMESTSIGNMQVMGFHWRELGFKSVGAMWDYAKVSEANQLDLGIRFIKTIPALDKALKLKDWYHVAYYYNGSGFMELAEKTGRVPYDKSLAYSYAHSDLQIAA